jgi:hypothetical protein
MRSAARIAVALLFVLPAVAGASPPALYVLDFGLNQINQYSVNPGGDFDVLGGGTAPARTGPSSSPSRRRRPPGAPRFCTSPTRPTARSRSSTSIQATLS